MLRWPPLRQEMQRRPHISPPLPPAPPTRPSSQGASSPAALAARGCGREFVPRPRLLVAFPRLLFPRAVSLSVVSVAPSSSGAVAPPPPADRGPLPRPRAPSRRRCLTWLPWFTQTAAWPRGLAGAHSPDLLSLRTPPPHTNTHIHPTRLQYESRTAPLLRIALAPVLFSPVPLSVSASTAISTLFFDSHSIPFLSHSCTSLLPDGVGAQVDLVSPHLRIGRDSA